MAADERQEGERVREPLLGRAAASGSGRRSPRGRRRPTAPRPAGRRSRRAAPRNRGGQNSVVKSAVATRDRHADHERDGRGDQRPDQQRQRAELVALDVPVVGEGEAEEPELLERRVRLDVEADEEEADQRPGRRRRGRRGPTSARGRAGARAAAARACGRPPCVAPIDACFHPVLSGGASVSGLAVALSGRRPWPGPWSGSSAGSGAYWSSGATLWPAPSA